MNEETLGLPEEEQSGRFKKTLKSIGFISIFVFFLILFTFTKLPQTKITGLIQGYVQMGLDPFGIYITDRGRELSIWKGFEYRLNQPVLELADQTRVELDEVFVKPNLLALIKGQAGARVEIKQGNSFIEVNGSGRGDKIDTTIQLTNADIGKLGLLSFAGGLKGSGIVSGTIHVDGTLSDPPSLNGAIQLKLQRLKLDEQNLMGFQLPTMNVNEGTIEITIDRGKLLMKNVQIGKPADDLQITATGDVSLNRFVNASALNIKAIFGLSENVKQSISLLESMLAGARRTDGKYAYKLTGTLGNPFAMPDTAQ